MAQNSKNGHKMTSEVEIKKRSKNGLNWPKMARRWPENGSKMAKNYLKMVHKCLKMAKNVKTPSNMFCAGIKK